jgi:hypothetical protein
MDRFQRRLLPVADFVMGVMWSRPHGLSLQEAWVTPATIVLGFAVTIMGLPGGTAAVAYGAGRHWIWFGAGLIIVGLGVGAGIVAMYGVRQRILGASADDGTTTD